MAAQIGAISETHASFALFASGGRASNRDEFKCYIKTKVQTFVWYRVDIMGWQNSWQNNRGKWAKFQVPRAWWWNAHRSAATYSETAIKPELKPKSYYSPLEDCWLSSLLTSQSRRYDWANWAQLARLPRIMAAGNIRFLCHLNWSMLNKFLITAVKLPVTTAVFASDFSTQVPYWNKQLRFFKEHTISRTLLKNIEWTTGKKVADESIWCRKGDLEFFG